MSSFDNVLVGRDVCAGCSSWRDGAEATIAVSAMMPVLCLLHALAERYWFCCLSSSPPVATIVTLVVSQGVLISSLPDCTRSKIVADKNLAWASSVWRPAYQILV